jgi:formylglycine-generating enzyme required for sulfatase activity
MCGNVIEWVADDFSLYPGSVADPEPLGKGFKVLRGGGFRTSADFANTTDRSFNKPDFSADFIGFRCVLDAPRVAAQ